jgi:hypothetical protein
MPTSHAEALRLIELAVLKLQAVYHPGRPMFMALQEVHREVRRARLEAGRCGGDPYDRPVARL